MRDATGQSIAKQSCVAWGPQATVKGSNVKSARRRRSGKSCAATSQKFFAMRVHPSHSYTGLATLILIYTGTAPQCNLLRGMVRSLRERNEYGSAVTLVGLYPTDAGSSPLLLLDPTSITRQLLLLLST